MNQQLQWFANEWSALLGPAIGAMAGEPAAAEPAPQASPSIPPPSCLIWRQGFDAAPGAECHFAFSHELWRSAGALVLQAAGIDSAEAGGDDARDTFLEIAQQAASGLASSLGARLHRDVSASPGSLDPSAQSDEEWAAVAVSLQGHPAGLAWICPNPALVAALNPEPRDVFAVPQPNAASAVTRPSKTMDLLLEVELPVGVSFGRTQMRLKDAIKLTTGSIVELNRSVTEPVELIVNNCVIARGEVVVVEGNYGVRIKQIVSREERLRTLF